VFKSNLGRISQSFQDTATYSLKHSIKNRGQTAADRHVVTIDSHQRPIWWCHRRPSTTYCLATIPHDWHTIVHYDPSRSFKVNDLHVIRKPICDFPLVISSNLGAISHRLATVHPWQTDGWTDKLITTMTTARPLLKYSRLKTSPSKTRNHSSDTNRKSLVNKPSRQRQAIWGNFQSINFFLQIQKSFCNNHIYSTVYVTY